MNGESGTSSDRLFATPTFWNGMAFRSGMAFWNDIARVFDLGGAFDAYRGFSSGDLADEEALRADWLTVGQDMEKAIQAGK